MGAKKFLPPRIQETRPTGPITYARQPLPVRVRLRWNLGAEYLIVNNAWAMAWTRDEVCIFWMEGDLHISAWLAASQVRRRTGD